MKLSRKCVYAVGIVSLFIITGTLYFNTYKDVNLMHKMQDGMSDKDILEYYGAEIEEVKTMTNGSIFIKTYSIDLNDDNLKDKLVYIISPLHSGSHGDTFEILLNNGDFYTVISDRWSIRMVRQDISHTPMGEIYILKSKTQTFHDIKIITDENEFILNYKNGKYVSTKK